MEQLEDDDMWSQSKRMRRKEVKHWLKTKNDVRGYTHRALYDCGLNPPRLDSEALSKTASIAQRYVQLKSGHTVIGTIHKRIRKRNSDRPCDYTF